jgi:hypothetical protein
MPAARALAAALPVVVVALTSCVLFPFPPFGGPAERELVVENETDDDWIIGVAGMFPQEFAIPASAVGEMYLLVEPGSDVEILLRTRDCETVDTLALASDTSVVRIGAGTLSAGSEEAVSSGEPAPPAFAPIFECADRISVASPAPGASGLALPATRMLLMTGMESSVVTLDLPEGALADLLAGPEPVMEAAQAPGGDALAFVRVDLGAPESGAIQIRNASGEERLLRENAAAPAWSPDGSMIAYIDTDPFSSGPKLGVIGADGSGDRILAERGGPASWSPNGELLAFVYGGPPTGIGPFSEPPTGELFVVGLDGAEPRRIGEAIPWSQPPAWSPDGVQLAFVAPRGAFDAEVHLLSVADGETRPLLGDGAAGADPAWSPDGRRIAISRGNINGATISVVEAQSGAETRLTHETDVFDAAPVWSPDGRWIAFVRNSLTGADSGLWVVSAEGGEPRLLATGVFRILSWRALSG